ncbi:MAG TPA: tryptophan synthase subunit alpha [Gammaproteobacteria bacterium]|nr:tryptophan synthase subunit alpha [Gammaproteobacteria bacterium]HAR90456.1 tryptophan synthase subunit alpha [Gammaproteobacteria bacterium]HBJ88688.1 tryptophan synthase subunit alpha [Gammaproteobacteria bacterium]|tara:strand:- start:266 stop:1099 length:834 start_codon:yes stop_codon:yes gene_type:complete
MSRIKSISEAAAAQGRKLLIPYLVAGDPDLAHSLGIMHELVKQGADIIEIGIPFSDPASDGPVIQRSVERALEGGTSLADTLKLVSQFREQDSQTGIVLMGYLNPIEIMGYGQFVAAATEAGIDGVLVVDMPPAESAELRQTLHEANLDTIYLVAPTTSAIRAKAITEVCSGYLYYVSLKGVTGAALTDHESVASSINELRQLTDLPIVIGFGIKDADSAAAMGGLSDGIIIGSALVERIADMSPGKVNEPDLVRSCEVIGAARAALDGLQEDKAAS